MPKQRAARPRLYFTGEDLPSLRQHFESVPALRQARNRLIGQAQQVLTIELPPESVARDGAGQHGNYFAAARTAERVIESCAFAYCITGETAYAICAAEALLHFARYESWTGAMFRSWDPPWNSALETATFTQAYAAGIDWLGEGLAEADQRTASEALARLGVAPLMGDWVDPSTRVHALDSMGHNWWMVCVAAAGVGALTLLGEDERASAWVEMAIAGLPEFFRYPGNTLQNKMASFDPDGGFYESLGYTNYTLLHYAYLMAALRHIYPGDSRFDALAPEVSRMAEFMLHFLYPRSGGDPPFISVDFGDHHRDKPFHGDVTLVLAGATGDGRYRWVFDRCTPEVTGPYQMLFHDESVEPVPPTGLPLTRALTGIGWAAMRDSWDDDATLLAIKCGDTWNHAHADAGSFVLYAAGRPLLIDSGACSYGRPEYRAYYTEAAAHNTVLLDGGGPSAEDLLRGSKFRGQIHPFLDEPGVRYVMADATGPSANVYRRFLRHFLWLDDAIIVLDDLLAHEPGRFEWLFHSEGTPDFREGLLTVGDETAKLEMRVLHPSAVDHEIREGYAPGDPDARVPYVALRHSEAAIDAKLLAVIRAGRELPPVEIESLEGPQWIGASLRGERWQWDIYHNLKADGRVMHRNSNLMMGRWNTDAYLLGERDGDQRRILLIGASYLRDQAGVVWFDCLSKCNVVLSVDGDLVTRATVQCPPGSRLRVRGAAPSAVVAANGATLGPESTSTDGPFTICEAPC